MLLCSMLEINDVVLYCIVIQILNRRTQCGWNNWRKMSGVLCDKRVPPHVKGNMHNMIVQPAMLYVMETVPMTSSHVKKLEVTEIMMCIWACGHTLRDHMRNDNIREIMSQRGAGKQDRGGLDTSIDETKNTSEEILWRWYHLEEESEEDRSRDRWTVSTGT